MVPESILNPRHCNTTIVISASTVRYGTVTVTSTVYTLFINKCHIDYILYSRICVFKSNGMQGTADHKVNLKSDQSTLCNERRMTIKVPVRTVLHGVCAGEFKRLSTLLSVWLVTSDTFQ